MSWFMSSLWNSVVRLCAGCVAGALAVPSWAGAEPGYFVFEGVVREADAVFGERVKPGWTFSGALEARSDLSGAPLSFEYTLDHEHLLEWEGAQLAESPAGSGVADGAWRYFRVPVQHSDAVTGEVPLGWAEIWIPLDTSADAETGYFLLSVWKPSLGVFGEIAGTLSFFAAGDPAGDLEERVGVLKNWVAELRGENDALRSERDRLRSEIAALRERIAGMEGMVDYLLEEKEKLRERTERAGREAAARSDSELEILRGRLAEQTAAAALLEQESDFMRSESLRMAERLALCEAENLRLRDRVDRLERENASLRPAARTSATVSSAPALPSGVAASKPPQDRFERVRDQADPSPAPAPMRDKSSVPAAEVEEQPALVEEARSTLPRGGLRRGSRRR